jgi:Protein of unknown function (DUF1559)
MKLWLPLVVVASVVVGLYLMISSRGPLVVQSSQGKRSSDDAYVCNRRLAEICRALLQYKALHASFPPATLATKSGHACSWRRLVLPYIDYNVGLSGYRNDLAWDDPHNEPITRLGILPFQCPEVRVETRINYTSYLYLTDYCTDERVVLVEVPETRIGWAEPKDVSLEDLSEMVRRSRIGSEARQSASLQIAAVRTSYRIIKFQMSNFNDSILEALQRLSRDE